jgi:hypothetical protein
MVTLRNDVALTFPCTPLARSFRPPVCFKLRNRAQVEQTRAQTNRGRMFLIIINIIEHFHQGTNGTHNIPLNAHARTRAVFSIFSLIFLIRFIENNLCHLCRLLFIGLSLCSRCLFLYVPSVPG